MQTIGLNQTLLEILYALRHLSDLFTKFMEAAPQQQKQDRWLSENDVMKIFKVTSRTIYNWKVGGDLEPKYMGGTPYYLESEVFKKEIKQNPPTQPKSKKNENKSTRNKND